MNNSILITGGAGFIASHVTDALIDEGYRAIVVDNLSSGNKKNLNKKAIFYKCDILSTKIEKIFKKESPETVFHFAAHVEARESVKDPIHDATVNILGSLNVLENCRKYGVKKIIFASSGGEIYGDAKTIPTDESYYPLPISPYGIAKFTVEQYLRVYSIMYGIQYISLRYGNVYGPRQNSKGEAGVIAIFAEKMLKGGQPLIHGKGTQTKDYIFVDDAVGAAMLSLKANVVGIFNIATGKETSVLEIFNELKKITGREVVKKHISFPLIGFERGCLNIKKAKKELAWEPTYVLEKGLQETVDWFKSN